VRGANTDGAHCGNTKDSRRNCAKRNDEEPVTMESEATINEHVSNPFPSKEYVEHHKEKAPCSKGTGTCGGTCSRHLFPVRTIKVRTRQRVGR